MPDSTVALTRCNDYSRSKITEAIRRQFELLGGIDRYVSRGDTVLLKPNFIAPKSRRKAAQTDPAVVLEVAGLLKDFGARPFVGDSPAWGNVYSCVKALKLEEDLKKMDIPIRQLNKPKRCVMADGTKVGISSIALDADVIINLPKFKSHAQLVGTFAVKNMFGTVSGKQKALWHFARGKSAEDFCGFLIEIYRFLNPALTIIDAVVVMAGAGPLNGTARELGWLIGGAEPIAIEAVCAELIGVKLADVPMVKTAGQMGYGCSETTVIKVVGDDFGANICRDFDRPQLIPVRFSLLHICKSICKQMLLLINSSIKKLLF